MSCMMRKLMLHPADFELFDHDIGQAEYEFFSRHKDVFKQCFVEQGKDFWIKFVMTFRKFSTQYGCMKDLSKTGSHYLEIEHLFDEAFINIQELFVEGTKTRAINFMENIADLAKHQTPNSCTPKTTANNPFYKKETRDAYRTLFGNAQDKSSYDKMYILKGLYLRFGGSLCKCLRRWIDAPDLKDGEEYWTVLEDDKDEIPKGGVFFELYLKETIHGHRSGPIYFLDSWPPKLNPKSHFTDNPLYDRDALESEDWRDGVSFEKFLLFVRWCQRNLQRLQDPVEDSVQAIELDMGKKGKKKKKKMKKPVTETPFGRGAPVDEPELPQDAIDAIVALIAAKATQNAARQDNQKEDAGKKKRKGDTKKSYDPNVVVVKEKDMSTPEGMLEMAQRLAIEHKGDPAELRLVVEDAEEEDSVATKPAGAASSSSKKDTSKPKMSKAHPFGINGGSFNFKRKVDGQPRFSPLKAAENELDRELFEAAGDSRWKPVPARNLSVDKNVDFSHIEMFDSFDLEHVNQISMYISNILQLVSRQPKHRMMTVVSALQDMMLCKISPHDFNTVVLKELPNAPVPLAEEFWESNLLRVQEAVLSHDVVLPAIPEPKLTELNIQHLLSKVDKPMGLGNIDRSRECRYFLRTIIMYAYHTFNVAKKREVSRLTQHLVDNTISCGEFVKQLSIDLDIKIADTWVTLLKGLIPAFRNALLMDELELEGIRPPPKDDSYVPLPKPTRGQKCYEFLANLITLTRKISKYANNDILTTIQSFVDGTTSGTEFAEKIQKLCPFMKEIMQDQLEVGMAEVRQKMESGECSLLGIKPPKKLDVDNFQWMKLTMTFLPSPTSDIGNFVMFMDKVFVLGNLFDKKILMWLQHCFSHLLIESIDPSHFIEILYVMVPRSDDCSVACSTKIIENGYRAARQLIYDGKLTIKGLETLKPPGSKSKAEKEALAKNLIQIAKRTTDDIHADMKSSNGRAFSKKPNGKESSSKKKVAVPEKSIAEKQADREKAADQKIKEALLSMKVMSKSEMADLLLEKVNATKYQGMEAKPPVKSHTLWDHVRDLRDGVVKVKEEKDMKKEEKQEKGKQLGLYLLKTLEKCRSKKKDYPHFVEAAENLVQSLVNELIPEELFYFVLLHIAYDHEEMVVGRQLSFARMMIGNEEHMRQCIRDKVVQLDGIHHPSGDDSLYAMKYGEEPIKQFKTNEYKDRVKALCDPQLVDYIRKDGMLLTIPDIDNLPGIGQDAIDAGVKRMLTRDPGVGDMVAVCARYMAVLMLHARIKGCAQRIIDKVVALATMDNDTPEPYNSKDFLRDLDRADIVPVCSHAHFLPFLIRVLQGFRDALASHQLYMKDLPPASLLPAKRRYAMKNGLPMPSSSEEMGLFDKTKHTVSRQSEPPVIRPPVACGQTPSDLNLLVDYFNSLVTFVEQKASLDPTQSPAMQKAFMLAKLQDVLDDTLSPDVFLSNLTRIAALNNTSHHSYVTFVKKMLGPLRKAMLAGKVKLPGVQPPRTDDQLYEAHYHKPPPTPFKPDEFKRSLRAPNSLDCPWQDAEPNLHDMPGITAKMVTDGKSRVHVLKETIDIPVLKTAQYLAILLVKMEVSKKENCESKRKLQELIDGTSDIRELYKCLEAEDIIVGRTHDNYAIFFQCHLYNVCQCLLGQLLSIDGIHPPLDDNKLYEQMYNTPPLVTLLPGEFRHFLKQRRSVNTTVTVFPRRYQLQDSRLAGIARQLIELPVPKDKQAQRDEWSQELIDGVINPETFLMRVEDKLVEEPNPMVDWFWIYVPMLEMCLQPLRRGLLSGKVKGMKNVIPPRTDDELWALHNPDKKKKYFEPDQYKKTLRPERELPFKSKFTSKVKTVLKKAPSASVVTKKKEASVVMSTDAGRPLKIESYLLAIKPVGNTLCRYLNSVLDPVHLKRFDYLYETCSMAFIETLRKSLMATPWMSTKQRKTRCKQFLHDCCHTRYNQAATKPAGLAMKNLIVVKPDTVEVAKELLLNEISKLTDEEATYFAECINIPVVDNPETYPDYSERTANFNKYFDMRQLFYRCLERKDEEMEKEECIEEEEEEEEEPLQAGFNVELMKPVAGVKGGVSQLLYCSIEAAPPQNLGPCLLAPEDGEAIQCWHSLRDGTTVVHSIDQDQAVGTTTVITPIDKGLMETLFPPAKMKELMERALNGEDISSDEEDQPYPPFPFGPAHAMTIPHPYESGRSIKQSMMQTNSQPPLPPTSPTTSSNGKTTTSKASSSTIVKKDKSMSMTKEKLKEMTQKKDNSEDEESKKLASAAWDEAVVDKKEEEGDSEKIAAFKEKEKKKKLGVQQAHQHRIPGNLTTARIPEVTHDNQAYVGVEGEWTIPVGRRCVIQIRRQSHAPLCGLCGRLVPPGTWIIDAENYLDEEPENTEVLAETATGYCCWCRNLVMMAQRHHLLPLLSHVFEIGGMKKLMMNLVQDAESCCSDSLLPAIQMKMADMEELLVTPDYFPFWELQMARRVLYAGELNAWIRSVEGVDALPAHEYVEKYVSNVPHFYEVWEKGPVKEFFYDRVSKLTQIFQTEGIAWLGGSQGAVLESMYRRYISNMPASSIGFHMTMTEVEQLDKAAKVLLAKCKAVMVEPFKEKALGPTMYYTKDYAKAEKKTDIHPKKKKEKAKAETKEEAPSKGCSGIRMEFFNVLVPAAGGKQELEDLYAEFTAIVDQDAAAQALAARPELRDMFAQFVLASTQDAQDAQDAQDDGLPSEQQKLRNHFVEIVDAAARGIDLPIRHASFTTVVAEVVEASAASVAQGKEAAAAADAPDIRQEERRPRLRQCAGCLTTEPEYRTYKRCQKCKEAQVRNPRFYCNRECQTVHWNSTHKAEHADGNL